MIYWLLIFILLTGDGHIKGIYYVPPLDGDPHKTVESCLDDQKEIALSAPENSILWCFDAKIPLPTYRLPA